jgi:methanogenic corrinoid protein MtbC1
LHDVGLRMVADFFEMAGWEALVVQAENSAEELLAQLGNPGAEVVGISVTQAINLGAAAELIRRIRSAARNPVRVLVGGYAFHQLPLLWQSLGADGTAANASEAVVLAGAQDAP